jgi:hypothetical protein
MNSVASASDTILASPVVSVAIGIIASGIGAAVVGIFRVLSRMSLLETQVADLGKDLAEVKHDLDVIKWGAVAGANVLRQQHVIPPMEES